MPFSFENALMLPRQKGSPHERAIDQNKQPTKIAAYPNRIYARGKASVQQPFHWRTPRVWISIGAELYAWNDKFHFAAWTIAKSASKTIAKRDQRDQHEGAALHAFWGED